MIRSLKVQDDFATKLPGIGDWKFIFKPGLNILKSLESLRTLLSEK